MKVFFSKIYFHYFLINFIINFIIYVPRISKKEVTLEVGPVPQMLYLRTVQTVYVIRAPWIRGVDVDYQLVTVTDDLNLQHDEKI